MMTFNCAAAVFISACGWRVLLLYFFMRLANVCKKKEKMKEKPRMLRSPNLEVMQH